uniref:CBS domain-containing protein n=1 Tax=Magnetococcus massalia (strain MO-1) TaxID=451514 RepID=A0A1S7LPA9_MAGMO|nr:Protein of unknown function. putative signal-transduction protein with CBS domains [Candidatus Magnetococcus massalia]
MIVRDRMIRNVITLNPGMTLTEAMRSVTRQSYAAPGFAVVLDHMTLTGLVTEFDFLKWIVQGRDPDKTILGDMRTSKPHIVHEDTPVQELLDLYTRRRFRRFPVLNEEEILCGGINEKQILACLPRTELLKHYRVLDVVRKPIPMIAPGHNYRETAQKMLHWHRGCVLVVDEGILTGICSERDMMRLRLEPDWSPEIMLEDFMRPNPVFIEPRLTLDEAMDVFMKGDHRRLPICEKDGTFRGMLSMTAILNAMADSQRSHQAVLNPESVPEPGIWVNPIHNHAILAFNEKGGALMGLTEEQISAQLITADQLVKDRAFWDALYNLLIHCGEIREIEVPAITAGGESQNLLSRLRLVKTPSGEERIFWGILDEA